jgi:NAD(P)H-flavin reductase
MILASIDCMLGHGVHESAVWLSMERNMQCGLGQCGHCQLGDKFLCKQGPVFNYPEVKHLLSVRHL